MSTLYDLTRQMASIDALLEETGGELTPELEELWQETGESLAQKIDNYYDLIKYNEDLAGNAAERIKELNAFKKFKENKAKRIKEHVKEVMESYHISKLEGKLCTISLTHSTSTEVDEDILLQPYLCRLARLELPAWITAELKVNKAILRDTFKDKDVTPAGVSFVKNTSLRKK